MSRKHRGDNMDVVKYIDAIQRSEKTNKHRTLKARAKCTHTTSHLTPALQYRHDEKDPNKVIWVCRLCGEHVDLTRLDDAKLDAAIETVAQAGNLIKLFAGNTDKDADLVDVVADIQFKTRAVLKAAYKAALKTTDKQPRNGDRRRRQSVEWT